MKVSSIILFPILLAVSSLTLGTTLHSMSKKEVEQAFVNKTATTIPVANLNEHAISNTFTGAFDDKGNAIAKFAHKPENGPQSDKGHYRIAEDGTMYITWQHWNDSKEFCIHVYDTKNAYVIIDCKNVFHTAFMKDAIQSGNHVK